MDRSKKRPKEWMDSWKLKNPTWEYILWDEQKIKQYFPNGLHNQDKYDEIEPFYGKADILRYEILYNYGGVYIDADIDCIKPLDELSFHFDFFYLSF